LALLLGIEHVIEHVDQYLRVINLSVGGVGTFPMGDAVIRNAHANDITLVAAAGNSATNASAFWPAANPYVITVGATGQDNQLAAFSNFGDVVDVVAPGVGIQSATLDNRFSFGNGTSLAAPFASAMVAMLQLDDMSATPETLRTRVREAVTPLSAESERSERYGYGLLNLNIALERRQEITESIFSIELDPSTNHDFGSVTVEYEVQNPHSILITNTGNQATGQLTVTLSGSHSISFLLRMSDAPPGVSLTIPSIAVGESAIFQITPAIRLSAETHQARVTVAGENGLYASFEVTFTVRPNESTEPDEEDPSGACTHGERNCTCGCRNNRSRCSGC